MVLPWTTMCWTFFRTHLLDHNSVYILAGDEVVRNKDGKCTYGLPCFFSSLHGRSIPVLSFLAVSLVSVPQQRSYPMAIEQIVRCETTSNPVPSPTEQSDNTKTAIPKRGTPKGNRNKNEKDVALSDTLKQLQTMTDYYSLRFQIEFNSRDAKQYWGLQGFMNVHKTHVNNAGNMSMLMVNVRAKLMEKTDVRSPTIVYQILNCTTEV